MWIIQQHRYSLRKTFHRQFVYFYTPKRRIIPSIILIVCFNFMRFSSGELSLLNIARR